MTTVETTRKTVEVKALPVEKLGSAAALIAESFRNEGFTRNTHNLSTRRSEDALLTRESCASGSARPAGISFSRPPTGKH